MNEKKELQKYAKTKFGVKLHGGLDIDKMKAKISELEGNQDVMREEAQGQAPAEEKVSSEDPAFRNEMNHLALRIWNGQSVSLKRAVREFRIISRLKDKGYTDEQLTKLELPE